MADLLDFGGDVGELNEAELLDSSDLQDVEGFDSSFTPSAQPTSFHPMPSAGSDMFGNDFGNTFAPR
jgi:hypothetical protein